MELPEYFDVKRIAEIGVLVVILVQYFKAAMPEKAIPYIAVVIGIAMSFVTEYYVAAVTVNYLRVVVNGMLGAIMADTAYQFLSGKKSPPLSLPSK